MCRKFRVAKNSMAKRCFVCLAVRKNFSREPCCAVFQKTVGNQKAYGQERSVMIFRRKFYVAQRRNISLGNPLVFQYFRVSKKNITIDGWGGVLGGNHGFPSKLLCFTVPNFRGATILFFRMVGVSKNFMPKKGKSQLSVENLLSHIMEELDGRTFLCFKRILVLGIFMDKGRKCQIFPSILLCLTVPKIFVVESFSVSLISGFQKLFGKRGREYHGLPSNFFCVTMPKKFLVEPFCVSVFFGYPKFNA